MTYSRVASKVDANQPAIVAALRKAGCSVTSLAAIGDGCPDLLVGMYGSTYLLEVKNPEYRVKSDPGKDLSDEEIDWLAAWRGGVVHVVYSVDEALAALGIKALTREA